MTEVYARKDKRNKVTNEYVVTETESGKKKIYNRTTRKVIPLNTRTARKLLKKHPSFQLIGENDPATFEEVPA